MTIPIDFPTVVWSMVAAAALVLAIVHGLVWWQSRESTAHGVFAVMAVGVAGMAAMELLVMRQSDPEIFGKLVRWAHAPGTFIAVALPVYLRLRLGRHHTGLFAAAIGSRLLVAALNFSGPQSIAWHEVRSLKVVGFLDSQVWVVDEAVPNPLRWMASLSLVLLAAYVLAIWISHLRSESGRSRKRESRVLATGYALWILTAIGTTILIHHGVLRFPYLISLSMLPLMGCIAWELSRDTLRAAAFARRLEEQTADIELAARVARIVHWKWDMQRHTIWSSGGEREPYGLPGGGQSNFEEFLSAVHEEDRAGLQAALARARETGSFHGEYRLRSTGMAGQARWILASGKMEYAADGQPLRMRGVSMDIGERKAAEAEARDRREEVARLSRVGALGEISGSLAHELNQPLSAILHNAETARRLLERQPPDPRVAAEACADVVAATYRAREVVQRLRAFLERGETFHAALKPDELVAEVLDMLAWELRERGITVEFNPGGVPEISGDRVQLQQVLLNLFLNAAEAMQDQTMGTPRLRVMTVASRDKMEIRVSDTGRGLPALDRDIFDPFVTNKDQGLGMGLAVCRTIARAHGGKISGLSLPEGGALFTVELPLPDAPASRP
jgi:C4-dicarboxylate-specific signal transduction histidine kinase